VPIQPEELQRRTRPTDPIRPEVGDPTAGEPRRPEVTRPDTRELLKRMRRVSPDQARRYRQRTGQ